MCLGLGQIGVELFAVFIDDADNHSEDEYGNESSDDVLPMRRDERSDVVDGSSTEDGG